MAKKVVKLSKVYKHDQSGDAIVRADWDPAERGWILTVRFPDGDYQRVFDTKTEVDKAAKRAIKAHSYESEIVRTRGRY